MNKKKIVFLMSFGHCGIDWLHSLLDSHPQILIMPSSSFYRTWKLLNLDSVQSVNEMHNCWINHFNSKKMQGIDTKQFYSSNEIEIFSKKLLFFLKKNGIDRKNTLLSIMDSYAAAKKIEYNDLKGFVEHEHVSYPYKEIFRDFDKPNILMIYRDPRASIAGYYKGIDKKYGKWPDIYEYFIDMSLEEWLNSYDLYKMYKNELDSKFKLVKNEELSSNTQIEMKKISKWLGIDYSNILTKSTYPSGLNWRIDSSYISKDKIFNKQNDDFFEPKEVKKRWMEVLKDKRDIIMIEFLLDKFFKEFGYKRITKNNIYIKLKGLLYFLIPHRGPKRFSYYFVNENELERFKNRLVLSRKVIIFYLFRYLPYFIQSNLFFIRSVIKNFLIIFLPGDRWKRYDNYFLEESYRINQQIK